MSIRKEIELTWRSQKYSVIITMGVIDKIEDQLNLVLMMQQASRGDVRFSKVARLFTILLKAGGANVTVEEVYKDMFSEKTDLDDLTGILSTVFGAIFPDEPKKKAKTTKAVKKK